MADFSIINQKIDDAINEEKDLAVELNRTMGEVEKVKSNLCQQSMMRLGVSDRLGRAIDDLEDCHLGMKHYYACLSFCLLQYIKTEKKVLSSTEKEELTEEEPWLVDLLKEIGKDAFTANALGAFMVSLVDLNAAGHADGLDAMSKYVDAGKNIVDGISDAVELAYENTDGKLISKLLGFGPDASKAGMSRTSAAVSEVTEFVDDFQGGEGVVKTTKAVASWAGVAFSFVSSGIDNYKEFGTVNSARFWGETVVEGGVDVALGVVGTTAATFLLGPGAPVVAVAAGGAAVTWVANKACELFGAQVLGKEDYDLGEAASDLTFGVVEGVADLAGWGYKAVTKGANAIWGNIVEAFT